MRRHVFERLLHDVQQVNPYFQQKLDRACRLGFSPHQKVTIALRMMAYASPTDAMDDTYDMSESTCLDTLAELCDIIVHLYKEEYLCEANQKDLDRLFRKVEDRGFLGTIGSLQFTNLITALGHSPLFDNLTEGELPQLDYYINDHQYNMGYYLADDIYPKWVTLGSISLNEYMRRYRMIRSRATNKYLQ
ncbi:uncharacterized protein LOC125472538 [Pyrus x bretschneideri]|uniref:uncharacterized protein LOC125472538 n=1 Tax=Pyrus x bretschneideri TaxID=225117 RepID=UPI00202DFB92|nr:uncharacterized protein LOC125472538 [Pyrus x bretschneideri]